MCDVSVLSGLIAEIEDDPEFITDATLGSATEILDAQDLIMRIHLAVCDAFLHQDGTILEELEWSEDPDYAPVTVFVGGASNTAPGLEQAGQLPQARKLGQWGYTDIG